MAIYKDLKTNNFSSALGLPSFMRDWLLQKFQNDDGSYDPEEISAFANRYLPGQEGWFEIKDRIINEYESVKLLAKIQINIDIATGSISFSLPDYGLTGKDTIIENSVWERYKGDLCSGQEAWALIELNYRPPDDTAKPKISGKIRLQSVRNFCPYSIDLDYYKDARKEFTAEEWIDILLGAADYNPDGYAVARAANKNLPDVEHMKLALLSRLLPFAEKRLNIIELAPKGTGKSYVFGRLSRYGWLSTSDKLTRAKLFYDLQKLAPGIVAQNDFIALDEIHKTSFDPSIATTLQAYLEHGEFTVGNYSGSSQCGMILCGNIDPELMESDGKSYMLDGLPPIFHDPAMIDRFHGFIKGWHVPRMNDDLKVCGWALNSEYFTAILHELRDDGTYRALVDEIIETPKGADTRDTEAIKRLATAFVKLLYPNARDSGDLNLKEFDNYCLRRAKDMRMVIKRQLAHKDRQYKWAVPQLTIREPRKA